MPDEFWAGMGTGKDIQGKLNDYMSIMSLPDVSGLKAEAAFKHIERLIEVSFELEQKEGIKHAIELAEELGGRALSPVHAATLHYFTANAWENLRLTGRVGDEDVWDWEQHEMEKELQHLRRALDREAIRHMPREYVCRTLSNMATIYNHVGRFSEAIECWDRALACMPSFIMGRGKRGYALTHYVHVLYEPEQIRLFLRRAHSDLSTVLNSGHVEAREPFRKRLSWIEDRLSEKTVSGDMGLFGATWGFAGEEEIYRRWCLENRLFLNPLNDLGPYPAGARDIMTPPAVIASETRRLFYHGYINQIKQAYVSARYLYYEGLNASEAHFSDNGVTLFDTQDYPTYSLAVEKVKAAFSMAYSLFDRIACFLNQYLGLCIPVEKVTFRTVWYNSQSWREGLREEFCERRNWSLRGLFWLSKELYEKGPGFGDSIGPEAQELSEIRYNLEHRYLNLHDGYHQSADTAGPPSEPLDPMAFSVCRGDFEAKTLRLLKMARAAQMYLCFAIHLEEKRRAKLRGYDTDMPALRIRLRDGGGKP
jgi:tetratricopeptide (TPR) repeat protein